MTDLYRCPRSQDLSILKEGHKTDTGIGEFTGGEHVSWQLHIYIFLNISVSKFEFTLI
jgi:hypothetical protein